MQDHKRLEEELRSAVRVFAQSIVSARGAVADMSPLIPATAHLPLSNLAYWERLIRDEFSLALRFFGGTAQKVSWPEPNRFLTWIDLGSWDGYVRERTLRTLSGPAPNSFFLALAARRLNDWVPQIRSAAREKIPALARASDPEHVSDVLCAMLPAWMSWGRMEDVDRQVVEMLLSVPQVSKLLRRRLIAAASGSMAIVLSQSARTPVLDEHLAEIAREAVQPSVRAVAYRTLLARKATWVAGRQWRWTDVRYCKGRLHNILAERPLPVPPPLLQTLESASTDRSSIVRRVAAEALVREATLLGDSALQLARRLAADASPSIAQRGAFVLQGLEVGAPPPL